MRSTPQSPRDSDPETWLQRVVCKPSVHSASLRYIGAVVRFPRVVTTPCFGRISPRPSSHSERSDLRPLTRGAQKRYEPDLPL